jgi:peptidoglycan/LPS O-acetylase OafA/YrhL
VEEWSYIVLPLLLLATSRFFAQSRRAAYAAISIMIVAPLLWRYFLGVDLDWLQYLRGTVFFRFDALGFGLLAAFLRIDRPRLWMKLQRHGWIGLIGVVIMFVLFWIDWPMRDAGRLWKTFALPILAVAVAGGVAWLSLFRVAPSAWIGPVVGRISMISYSLYLLHNPLEQADRYLVYEVFRFSHARPWQILQFGSSLLLIFAVSSIFYRFWEKPMMDLRRPVGAMIRRSLQPRLLPSNERN